MSKVPDVILYGLRDFALTLPKIQSSPRKLDTVSQSFNSSREDTFLNSRVFPGYPLIEVEEVETKVIIPGMDYEHSLRGKGLLQARPKLESRDIKQPEEGFDEIPETWITHRPLDLIVGSAHPLHPHVFLNARESIEQVTEKIFRVQCGYKGIILDALGNPKPQKWKGTVNAETISTSSGVTLGHATPEIFTDETGAYNGWTVSVKGRFYVCRPVLICTELTTTPPPTDRIGMQMTPDQIPVDIYSIFDEEEWFAESFTFNYPGAAWMLAGVQFDQVLNKSCFAVTKSFEYQPLAVPTL